MDLVLENREWRIVPGELEVGLGTWQWSVLSREWRVGSRDWRVGWGLGTGDIGQGISWNYELNQDFILKTMDFALQTLDFEL